MTNIIICGQCPHLVYVHNATGCTKCLCGFTSAHTADIARAVINSLTVPETQRKINALVAQARANLARGYKYAWSTRRLSE